MNLVFKQGGGYRAGLNYPVIIYSSFSNIYSVDFFGEIEVQYAYTDEKDGTPRDDYFLIDIVEFDRLAALSAALLADAETACDMLSYA